MHGILGHPERPTHPHRGQLSECTKRYTVILDTRMAVATSATVRNFTSASGDSPPDFFDAIAHRTSSTGRAPASSGTSARA